MLFRRGAIVTTFIVCYALTSFISGYVSGGMYSRHGGMYLPSGPFCLISDSPPSCSLSLITAV